MGAILALDLGTKTGWAIARPDGSVTSGTMDFKPRRYEGGGMRYLRFRSWLEEIVASCGVSAIYFEEVRRHLGVDAAHAYGGFLAELTAHCDGRDPAMPYAGVPVATIKRHGTGKGNAGKPEMIEAARRLGCLPADDNEADARVLADYALKHMARPA